MAEPTQTKSTQRDISRGTVAIYKKYFGRGPTWAQSTIADTHVTVVITDALTVVEQRLAEEGNHETVRSLRRKVQTSMAKDMTELVERLTGRTVRCMLSDHDVPTDTAVEVLVFEREADEAVAGISVPAAARD